MTRVVAFALALAVVAPALASADDEAAEPTDRPKKRKKKHKEASSSKVSVEAESTGGVLTGEGTVRQTAAFIAVAAEVTPSLTRDRWEYSLPVSVEDRETMGASFPERIVEADPEARWKRGPSLHASAHGGAAETWRPDWPDPYQPGPGGTLLGSSRHSHFDVFGGVELGGIPVRHHHARTQLDVRHVDYDADENYDPDTEPTHLIPGDHTEIELDTSWKYHADTWKAGAAVDVEYQVWEQQYARDAGTGLTHAGAGGAPPNPMQQFLTVEPALVCELAAGRVEVDASYGVGLQTDLYDGYYSYVEQHPELDVSVELGRAKVKLANDLRWRTYGGSSYAVNAPSHPMLDFGDRRSDRTFSSTLDVRVAIAGHFTAIGGAGLKIRRTNFPDYVPGVFPMTATYAIDWDYDDVTAFAGVAWSR